MIQPIILAAGKGTRMGSDLPKTLCSVAGKPMLGHILQALASAGNTLPPVIVVGHKGEQVKQFVGDTMVTVEQTELSGTGTAARIGLSAVPTGTKKVFIMYGDHPFISAAHIKAIEEQHDTSGATVTLATATVPDFTGWHSVFMSFGRVLRNVSGAVQEIREYKNATEYEQTVHEINPGFYCVDAVWLAQALEQIEKDAITSEYYLTDIVSLALYENKKVETVSISPEEALGINSPEDVAQAEALFAQQ